MHKHPLKRAQESALSYQNHSVGRRDIFINRALSCIESCKVLFSKCSKVRNVKMLEPWMSYGLSVAIIDRDKMYKKLKNNPINDLLGNRFLKFLNKICLWITEARLRHYSRSFDSRVSNTNKRRIIN